MRRAGGWAAFACGALLAALAAQAQDVSTLRLVASAGAQGRGETLAAETGSVLLAHGNPAALAGVAHAQVALAYRRWIEGSGLYTVAASTPAGARGHVALLATAFDAADGAVAAEAGFEVRALNVMAVYAYGRGPLRVGLGARYVLERDGVGQNAHGAALDAGVQAGLLQGGVRVGAAVQHVGTIGELPGQRLTLPAVLRVGIAAEPLLVARDALDLGPVARILVAADLVRDLVEVAGFEKQTRLHVGGEVEAFDLVVGRAGYLFGDSLRGATLGLGLRSGAFAFDFAYQPFADDVGTGQGVALRYEL